MTNTIETLVAGFTDGGNEKSDGWIVSGLPSSISVKLAAESPPFLHVSGAQAFGCAAVHLDHRLCTLATVQRYQAQGLQVGVWTVNSLLRKQEVASWGVARIITDSP